MAIERPRPKMKHPKRESEAEPVEIKMRHQIKTMLQSKRNLLVRALTPWILFRLPNAFAFDEEHESGKENVEIVHHCRCKNSLTLLSVFWFFIFRLLRHHHRLYNCVWNFLSILLQVLTFTILGATRARFTDRNSGLHYNGRRWIWKSVRPLWTCGGTKPTACASALRMLINSKEQKKCCTERERWVRLRSRARAHIQSEPRISGAIVLYARLPHQTPKVSYFKVKSSP